MPRKDEIAQFFEDKARRYDEIAGKVNSRYARAHQIQNSILHDYLRTTHRDSWNIVDLGCGTGTDCRAILESSIKAHYLGIDYAKAMLDRAQSKAVEYPERSSFFEGDLRRLSASAFRTQLEVAFKQPVIDAVVIAYVLHHFGLRQRRRLYRFLTHFLAEGACLLLTDLFNPKNPKLKSAAEAIELDDIRTGFQTIVGGTEVELEIEMKEWLDHYAYDNQPAIAEDELAHLEALGFQAGRIQYQDGQNKVISAIWPGKRIEKSFDTLFSELNSRIARISIRTAVERRDSEYKHLFSDDARFRDLFYGMLNISGAAFVASDTEKNRFLMLQPGASGFEDRRDMNLALPISDLPSSRNFLWRGDVSTYNRFINHIFLAQRSQQGLGVYGDHLHLNQRPEFLKYLSPGIGSFYDRASNPHDDWHYCNPLALTVEVAAWRWLLWLLNHHSTEFFITRDYKVLEGIEPNRPPATNGYFNDAFFKHYRNISWNDPALPEVCLSLLDAESAWHALPGDLFSQWRAVRSKTDASLNTRTSFFQDIHFLKSFLPKGMTLLNLVEKAHARLVELVSSGTQISSAFALFHEKVVVPVCPYFYYLFVDGKAKAHFVAPIFRSESAKLSFSVGRDTAQQSHHTAVAICLASLDGEKLKNAPLLQIKTALKMCADRLIDRFCIRGIVEGERSALKHQGRRILEASHSMEMPRVSIIGTFDRSITFYSQQSRALFLVRALSDNGVFEAARTRGAVKIAVVGGGLAGVTAAAACQVLGHDVTIFEPGGKLLSLQRKASHRYIHPHLAEWPDENSMNPEAQLPFLTWRANTAPSVLQTVKEQYDTLLAKLGIEAKIVPKRVTNVHNEGDKAVIVAGDRVDFDLAIVAVGFGNEEPGRFSMGVDYWAQDPLDTTVDGVVISGRGDGALIDAMRATLDVPTAGDSSIHGVLLGRVLANAAFRELGEHFYSVDKRVVAKLLLVPKEERDKTPNQLFELYENEYQSFPIEKREELGRFVEALNPGKVDVTLLRRSADIFSLKALLLNRALVFLLIKHGFIIPVRGEVIGVKEKKIMIRHTDTDAHEEIAGVYITRHGPPPDYKYIADSLPSLAAAASELGGKIAEMEIGSELDKDSYDWWTEKLEAATRQEAYGHLEQ